MKRLFTEEEVREIIGKENTLPFRVKAGLVGQNHPQKDECQFCWQKETEFHKADCPILEAQIRNQLRHEQLTILEKMRGEEK